MDRYIRNILVSDFGQEGQEKLNNSKVLVVGAGGLGSPVLYYLASSGIGTLGIVDYDKVEITNLQRQIIHYTPDLGKNKIDSAKEKIFLLNPDVQCIIYNVKLSEDNALDIIKEYDFIVDCSDSYDTKYLINDICVKANKPYSHGSALSMQGEAMTYVPGNTCYRCVFDMPPEPDNDRVLLPDQAGVLGPITGIIGSIQAAETIKYITGLGEMLVNRILIFDGKNMNFTLLKVKKESHCICR